MKSLYYLNNSKLYQKKYLKEIADLSHLTRYFRLRKENGATCGCIVDKFWYHGQLEINVSYVEEYEDYYDVVSLRMLRIGTFPNTYVCSHMVPYELKIDTSSIMLYNNKYEEENDKVIKNCKEPHAK